MDEPKIEIIKALLHLKSDALTMNDGHSWPITRLIDYHIECVTDGTKPTKDARSAFIQ